MTQKKHSAKNLDWKEIFESDTYGLRALVQQVVQEVLEAEMEETVGARKGERTESRLGYRSGYYSRTLVTRVGKLVLGCRRTGWGGSEQTCSSGISGARRRWYRR